jgi:hypothetical protein
MSMMAFTYIYGMRMRPNAYPKPAYKGIMLIDADAPFTALKIEFWLDGHEDECAMVRDRYQIKFGKVRSTAVTLDNPLIFQPGDAVPVVLMRGEPRPQKLRKRVGIDIEIWIFGLKEFPELPRTSVSESGLTGEPNDSKKEPR